jgi:minor histocompatibility antigen H13
MGFGFVYAGLQLMSPTTFWTGTLVLTAMFIYDVVMVFYTPMMITVAKSLDVPIKILLPGATRTSMLGLGDIILPGIIMALALRFDLYLHYLRKQRTSLSLPKTPGGRAQQVFIGAPYVDATGKWGERFWTRRGNKSEVTAGDAARFSKIYFKASIVGYIIALILTVVIMAIFNHGQPALLYLVPAVLIALWGTALVRGEALLMWGYTEDGSIDVEARLTPPLKKVKEGSDDSTSSGDTDHSGNTDSSGGGAALRAVDSDNTSITEGEKSEAEAKKGQGTGPETEKEREKDEHAHHVFLFSLSEPRRPCAKKTSVFEFKGAD